MVTTLLWVLGSQQHIVGKYYHALCYVKFLGATGDPKDTISWIHQNVEVITGHDGGHFFVSTWLCL